MAEWKNLLVELNNNSTIVAIISSVVTGIVVGGINYFGIKKSTDAALKMSSDNIEFQKNNLAIEKQEKAILAHNQRLFEIYDIILQIERDYNLTSIYIESDKDIDENNNKYFIHKQNINKAMVYIDLYFKDLLSEDIYKVNNFMNLYWGYLDYHFRHKKHGNKEQSQKNLEEAYNETQKIQSSIEEIKHKLRKQIKK